MKIKMFLAGAGFMLVMTTNAIAQAVQHDSIHVKIMKNENGTLTGIDTTVAASQHDQLVQWLSSQGIELPPPPPPPGMPGDTLHRKMMMVIEAEDSLPPGAFRRMPFPPPGMEGDSMHIIMIERDSMHPGEYRHLPPPPPGAMQMRIPPPPPGHEGDIIIYVNDSTGTKQECRKTIIINNMPPPPPPAPGQNSKMQTKTPPPQHEVVVYPNPSKGHFTLGIDMPGKEKTELLVIDANGKTVYSEEIPGTDGKISKEIDLSKNGKGIYSVRVSKGGKVIVEKIVVE